VLYFWEQCLVWYLFIIHNIRHNERALISCKELIIFYHHSQQKGENEILNFRYIKVQAVKSYLVTTNEWPFVVSADKMRSYLVFYIVLFCVASVSRKFSIFQQIFTFNQIEKKNTLFSEAAPQGENYNENQTNAEVNLKCKIDLFTNWKL
jgi:hypothetical protein